MIYIPNDFAMDRTPAGLMWRNEDMSGIPRIRSVDGSIFEPTLRYFAYCWLNKLFKAKSSMQPDSYSLREWLCYITNLGYDWVSAGTDDVMRSFRSSFAERVEEGELAAAQVELKLDHIFSFYQRIKRAMPFIGEEQMPQFVGHPESLAPITTRRAGGAVRWSGWNKIGRKAPNRPTPDDEEVARILEHLRAAAMERSNGTWEQELRICAAERNWLVACCEARAGLRAKETASLSLQKIAEALAKLKIVNFSIGRWRSPLQSNPLNDAVGDQELQALVRQGLERHAARGHTTINIVVKTKARPERSVEFPIDLVIDLLEIAVWKVRKALFERWAADGKVDLDDDAIFLSSTGNGTRLAIKSITDIVKDAFNALFIGGSGHRLRAYYFTEMAWLLWTQELATAGYRSDVAITNTVLNRLADLAGHKTPGTMEQYYLDRAKLRQKLKRNKPTLDARKDMMHALIGVSWDLDEGTCRRLQRVIYAFSECEDSQFFAVIDAAIDKYVHLKERPQPDRSSHLRLITSDDDP